MVEEGGGASQTTDPALGSSSATDVSLREYMALGQTWLWRVMEERDRRYTEVQRERDKALVIQASNQAYRDEKANELREQISEERGKYVSQQELAGALSEIKAILTPVVEYVASQQGSRQGHLDLRQLISWGIAAILGLWAIAQAVM